METYTMEFKNTVTYQVEVEASSIEEAFDLTADWGRDDFKEEEIVDNVWEITV